MWIHVKECTGAALLIFTKENYETFHCESEGEAEYMYAMYMLIFDKRASEDYETKKGIEVTKKYLEKYPEFMTKFIDDWKIENFAKDFWCEVPYDSGYDCSCCLKEITVTYFDNNGIEYQVTVEE